MKSILKSISMLGISVLFWSNTVYAKTLMESIGPFANSGKPKNVNASFEDQGSYLARTEGVMRMVTFEQSGAFVVDGLYIIVQDHAPTMYSHGQQFTSRSNTEQWVKFRGYVPRSAACGAIAWVTITIHMYKSGAWKVASATTYMVVASTPTISGITPLCTTSDYYTINSNGHGLQGPFNWTSSDPAFTITGNGQTVEIGSVSNAVSTTITVSGGGLCQSLLFRLHRGTPRTPGNVWTELILPSDFHCFSGAVTENVSNATSYIWTAPKSEETFTPESSTRLTRNRTYYLSVKAKNACGLSGAASSTETTRSTCTYEGREYVKADSETQEFSVFPNPANTSFQINIPSNGNKVCVKIMNVTGQVVQNIITTESRLTIQTTDIPAGLYLININSNELNLDTKIQVIK